VSCGLPPTFVGSLDVRVTSCPLSADATAIAWAVDQRGTPVSGPSTLHHLDLSTLVNTTVAMPAFTGAPASITGVITLPTNSQNVEWAETYYQADDAAILSYAASSPPATPMTLVAVGNHTRSTVMFQPPNSNPLRYDQADASLVTDFAFDAGGAIRSLEVVQLDLLTQTISWTEGNNAAAPTIVNAIVVILANGQTRSELHIHAPYTGASLALPPLPAEIAPHGGDTGQVQTTFELVDGTDYATLVQQIDSYVGATPIGDPAFVGKVWSE
jgi:hypothetical protein